MEELHQKQVQEVIDSSSQTLTEEKERLEGQAQKFKDLAETAETEAISVKNELAGLKGRVKSWVSELNRINAEISSMFSSFFYCRDKFLADIYLIF